jgi:uncharacterized phosphosugar-binding protein
MNVASGIERYLAAIQKLQAEVIAGQLDLLGQVAEVMSETIAADQRIFTFGTGHSHMLAEEGHYRAGGLAPVVPILLSSLMLHEDSILSGVLERAPGLAEPLLGHYAPQPGELLFIFSNSGVNHLPVELALTAKAQGLTVVSVSALAYAQVAPRSALEQRLDEVADYAIDNGGQPGDSLLSFAGVAWPTGPSSTVIGALLWQCLVSETVRRLGERGLEPPLYASANMPGATEHNKTLLARWRSRNPHL